MREGNCAVSPGVGLTKLNLPQQTICVGASAALANTCFHCPGADPLLLIYLFNFLGQITAGLARTECQIAGAGSSQGLASHPNSLKLGFKTTCEERRCGGKSLMQAKILQ